MSTISLPGLSTGIDTSSLISQLVQAESTRLTAYQTEQANLQKQKTTLETVKGKVSALKSATSALANKDDLNVYSTTSSDSDILTISASSKASSGSHSIEINQLATTNTWIQNNSNYNYETEYVGDGTFIYTYNHQSRAITTVANETTLEDLVNKINKDTSNPGVTASLLYNNGKYSLMLSGRDAGEEYQISVDSKYTEVWKSQTDLTSQGTNAALTTKIQALDQFKINNGFKDNSEKIIISGKNHFGTTLANQELKINDKTTVGQLIDAINKQFDGVATATFQNGQIVLTDNISDNSNIEISLSYDAGTGNTALNLPAMAVSTEGGGNPNVLQLGTFIETHSAQSSRIKLDGYPLSSNNEVQKLIFGSSITGTYTLSYNGKTSHGFTEEATAADIQTAIKSDFGLEDGDITVSGDSTSGFTFTFKSSFGDAKKISIDASGLTFSGANSALVTEETKGNNGYIERNTNSISDALTGITLNLKDVTKKDSPVKVTISRNTSTVSQKIQTLVKAYNDLITELKTDTEYDATSKTMGILSDNVGIAYIKAQSSNPFLGMATGFTNSVDSFIQGSDIGITFDGEGMMQFDTSKFNTAINKDFNGVLDLLGADKTSNNNTGVIQYYAASSKYTKAGIYNVEVDINDSHQISDARIKMSNETVFRSNSNWISNLVTGNTDFDKAGNPIYAENGLQFTVDLSKPAGTYSATISVKQGMVNSLDEYIGQLLKTNNGIDISEKTVDDKITDIKNKMDKEQTRLTNYKKTLVDKYARLEKTLTLLQQQMSSVQSMGSSN